MSIASARHTATTALSESLSHGADSPLSLWVYKLSKRLHIGKINNIRGTRGKWFELYYHKFRGEDMCTWYPFFFRYAYMLSCGL